MYVYIDWAWWFFLSGPYNPTWQYPLSFNTSCEAQQANNTPCDRYDTIRIYTHFQWEREWNRRRTNPREEPFSKPFFAAPLLSSRASLSSLTVSLRSLLLLAAPAMALNAPVLVLSKHLALSPLYISYFFQLFLFRDECVDAYLQKWGRDLACCILELVLLCFFVFFSAIVQWNTHRDQHDQAI